MSYIILIDDYWKKFFLNDDIAMLLTDVSRSVSNVEYLLQKQLGGRRISRSSLKSLGSPPTIFEVSFFCLEMGGHRPTLPSNLNNVLFDRLSIKEYEQCVPVIVIAVQF